MKKITLLAALFAVFAMNGQIFSDDFNGEVLDAITFGNWASIDDDGDGEFWEVFDTANIGTGASIMSGLGADSDSWEGGNPFSPDNYLITANPIDLTGSSATQLTFKVGTYQVNGTFLDDEYSVYLTASNDPGVISGETAVLNRVVGDDVAGDQADGSASAAEVSVDISAFDGQIVYLTFRHHNTTDQNSVLIDDVVVDGILGVDDNNLGALTFVSNNEILTLRNSFPLESVQLFNVLGQEVISQKLSNTVETVKISALNSGVYIARVTADGQIKTIKIVKR